jgi:hypothetical protein
MSSNLDVYAILTELAGRHHRKFMYSSKEVPVDQVFSPTGALPLIVKRANLLSDFLFGESLKVQFKDDPTALTGERLEIADKQHRFTLVMLLYDVLEEVAMNSGDGDILLS